VLKKSSYMHEIVTLGPQPLPYYDSHPRCSVKSDIYVSHEQCYVRHIHKLFFDYLTIIWNADARPDY